MENTENSQKRQEEEEETKFITRTEESTESTSFNNSKISYSPNLPIINDILQKKITNLSEVEELDRTLKEIGISDQLVYKAFYPMVRVKGFLGKMHVTRLAKH